MGKISDASGHINAVAEELNKSLENMNEHSLESQNALADLETHALLSTAMLMRYYAPAK